MSNAKVVLEGLKSHECERIAGRSKPPIRCIPKKDVSQEALEASANMLKLALSHKVKLCAPVWSKGPSEQFLVYVQQALDAIRKKGLLIDFEKANNDKQECITS